MLSLLLLSVFLAAVLLPPLYFAVRHAYNRGYQQASEDLTEKMARFEVLLSHAGLSMVEDLPRQLQEVDDDTRSWTGIAPVAPGRPPGTVARWDERHR